MSPELRIVVLGSGSAGNALLVEAGKTRLLVDAGLPAKTLARRLSRCGCEPGTIDYVLLTHEHQDHARGAERFSRLHDVTVVSSHATLDALDRSPVHFHAWRELRSGARLALGDAAVEAFPVPHDAAQPVGFVVQWGAARCGIVTDIGHPTTLVAERLSECDALVVEANHDDRMLRAGPYPWQLKQRVAGRYGHLSNHETASLLERVVGSRCRDVVLAHLSERNNRPELARQAAEGAIRRAGRRDVRVHVAGPRGSHETLIVKAGASRPRGQLGLF